MEWITPGDLVYKYWKVFQRLWYFSKEISMSAEYEYRIIPNKGPFNKFNVDYIMDDPYISIL